MPGKEDVIDPAVGIPLAVFSLVDLVVGILCMARIHDTEAEIHRSSHYAEIQHRRKLKELDLELERLERAQ